MTPLADLVFGTPEVLVAAKHLVNGRNVQIVEGGMVTYVHLLFDQHEIILSNGLATESFLPGPQTLDAFENTIIEEIIGLFPELDPETGEGYGAAARQILKKHEGANAFWGRGMTWFALFDGEQAIPLGPVARSGTFSISAHAPVCRADRSFWKPACPRMVARRHCLVTSAKARLCRVFR